jgi:SurA-like N-terminal domain
VRRVAPLVAALALSGCGGHEQSVPPGAIAVVGDRAVTRAEFDHELARARRANTDSTPERQLRDAVVRLLVDRAQLESEAARAGVVVSPAQVDARLRRLKQTTFGGDESRYRAQLRRTGMTEADVRAAIRAELLTAALRGRDTKPSKVVYAPGFGPSGEP